MNEQLELAFRSAIESSVAESIDMECPPFRIMEMLARGTSPVEVARKLILSVDYQRGFKKMHERGRADLTIESIMLKPEFAALFTNAELAAAQWRLDDYKNKKRK